MQPVEQWAEERSRRIRGRNPYVVLVNAGQRFSEVRVPGLAAEMTYYALISLAPFIIAVGASLGLLEQILGPAQVAEVENAMIGAIDRVFSAELTEDVLGPLVRNLLAQERAGVALISLIITFLFASAVFRAAIRALDDAYRVPERRGFLHVWGLAYVLALGSVLVVVALLSFLVVGPLMGGGQQLAEWLGLGRVGELIWQIGRWPIVMIVAVSYLAWLYYVGPNVDNTWRKSLPGAVAATAAAILIAIGLQIYLEVAGPGAPFDNNGADDPDPVRVASQTLGAVLAVVLWIWLTSIAVLAGGVLNAELRSSPTPAGKNQPGPESPAKGNSTAG